MAESDLRKALESYANLNENWDEEGAKAPSQKSVYDALTFMIANR